ncbi:MAG: hypothetical protein HHAS10_02430 [Candidatus Altimarinota bacterium]
MKLRIAIALVLSVIPALLYADIDFTVLQKQGFESFTSKTSGSEFVCEQQCFIILGNLNKNEFIEFSGDISGKGVIGYGFLNGNQILAGGLENIEDTTKREKKFNFSSLPYYSQLPKEMPIILIVNGALTGKNFQVNIGQYDPLSRFIENFKSATHYTPFTPRTINFLEGPMWGGVYINKAFFPIILFLLSAALIWSMFEKESHGRFKKSILFGFFILVFFWIFFDFFSSFNQVRMYKDFASAPNFMSNGRLAKNGDFYQFLDFVRSQVKSSSKGNFIAPYPYDSEGKYHMYPYVKFKDPEELEYVFTYNPYGGDAPFGFVDPIYDENSKILSWNPGENRSYRWNIEKVQSFGDFGKIYVIQK